MDKGVLKTEKISKNPLRRKTDSLNNYKGKFFSIYCKNKHNGGSIWQIMIIL